MPFCFEIKEIGYIWFNGNECELTAQFLFAKNFNYINESQNAMVNKFWSSSVKSLTPYTPGEQPLHGEEVVKLNTNENPYPPSPKVREAILVAMGEDAAKLRLYPDPAGTALRQELAQHHAIEPDQIFLGNGSDEVLAHVFLGLLKHKASVLFADITYSFYPVYCALYGIEYERVPLSSKFEIRVNDYLHPQRQPNSGIVIANPNAPTGIALPLSEVERLVKANQQSVVVVDEAYVDFGGETAIPLVKQYKNILVVRTFSKSRAMAGMRLAYAVGDASLITGLNKVKDSFNSYPLDMLAQTAGIASVRDDDYFQMRCKEVIATREELVQQLEQLQFEVMPSATNFLFVKPPKIAAEVLAQELKKRKILVRHFKAARIDDYLRVTVGTQQECQALISACSDIL